MVELMNGADNTLTSEVAVVGGGPAGLVSAIALAAAGAQTLLIAPRAEQDHRTTALLASSVKALETLGVWQACRPYAAPLQKLRIVDDTQRLFRAPETFFCAAEIELDAFGHNIENRYLVAALEARVSELKISRIGSPALVVKSDADSVQLRMPTVWHASGLQSAPMGRVRSAAQQRGFQRSSGPIHRRR